MRSPDDVDEPMDLPGLAAWQDLSLRRRLLARVTASVQAHREYVTVRRDASEFVPAAPGVAWRRLWQGAGTRAALWRVDAGAALPWHQEVLGQEALVLSGEVHDGEGPLGRHGFVMQERSSRRELVSTTAGAEVFMRERVGEVPPLEARWWALAAGRACRSVDAGRRWSGTRPGVRIHRLWGDTQVVSMLVRFDAGASVADHKHELDEDCLVLEGEMFLGDILLRAGDYQLAPAGGGHWGEMSDVGCLFYFHGALDPALR